MAIISAARAWLRNGDAVSIPPAKQQDVIRPAGEVLTGPAPAPLDPVHIWLVFGALLLGFLLASLDQTIVATALPTIVRELGGLYYLSWVVTAYMLAATASAPIWGKLGDLYGRKRLFQTAIVLFLLGSGLCGLSQNIAELIGFRALQGLGAGGLFVTAQAIIADVVAPRERGRYQGFLVAVFGVSSVAGPLLGGWFVDNASWRWVFYVNLPIGIVALLVVASVLHLPVQRRPHVIDYPGAVLVSTGAIGLVLVTTLGGTTYPWLSAPIVLLAAASVTLLAGFVWVEQRSPEPLVPLTLFRNRVFSLTAAIGFLVAFALIGATTYVSLFLQVVTGSSPTSAGLRLAPMMAGLFLASVISGQLIAHWGRYKPFPIVGTALMALSLFLLSRMDEATDVATSSGYLLVLGIGIGLVMQVLVLAVQNAVEYRDVGVATSGAGFFRSIGGSFGVAILGAVFSNLFDGRVADLAPGTSTGDIVRALSDPLAAGQLPAGLQPQLIHAFASSLDAVFLVAVPLALAAFLLTLFLPEIPLRRAEGPSQPNTELQKAS